MKGYLKNMLVFISIFELKKNNAIEELVSKMHDNDGIERVRVNIITSSCNYRTDLT